MQNVSCPNCGATTQTDATLSACPACSKPLPTEAIATAPMQSVANDTPAASASSATAPASAPAIVAPAATSGTDGAAPVAPESTGAKIATGIEIGLADVNAVAGLISKEFAGTPVAAIFSLLGPIAGIGAAVLAQHLSNRGFDLSQLKPAEIL